VRLPPPFPRPPVFATYFAEATKVKKASTGRPVRPTAVSGTTRQKQIPSSYLETHFSMKKYLALLTAFFVHSGAVSGALIAHYTFDNAGDMGNDSQGFEDGSLAGTLAVTGVNDAERGAVLQMAGGSNGYIHSTIGTLPGGGFTLSAWVKSTSWSGNRGVFQVQNGAGTTVSATTKVIGAWVGGSGIAWGRVIDNAGTQTMPQSGPALTTGGSAQWHHLAYRGNGSSYQGLSMEVGTGSVLAW